MTKNGLLEVMRQTATIPLDDRMIYQAQDHKFYMDYATYGGTTEEVPRALIDELQETGLLRRAYPDQPHINAWILAEETKEKP